MKITKPDHVLLLQNYHVIDKQAMLFVSLGYVVDKNHQFLSEQDCWPWLLSYFQQEPLDMAFKKQRGTFAVAGKAYAPADIATSQMKVSVQLGDLSKTLYVFGDRYWQQGTLGWIPSSPRVFNE